MDLVFLMGGAFALNEELRLLGLAMLLIHSSRQALLFSNKSLKDPNTKLIHYVARTVLFDMVISFLSFIALFQQGYGFQQIGDWLLAFSLVYFFDSSPNIYGVYHAITMFLLVDARINDDFPDSCKILALSIGLREAASIFLGVGIITDNHFPNDNGTPKKIFNFICISLFWVIFVVTGLGFPLYALSPAPAGLRAVYPVLLGSINTIIASLLIQDNSQNGMFPAKDYLGRNMPEYNPNTQNTRGN